MHWAEKLAKEVIARNPNKKEFVVAAGISPSGSIHIGNFRDVATSLFVAKMLVRLGKKVRFVFSWDNLDRMRKVPKNVLAIVNDEYDKYIGYPLIGVPNPFNTSDKTYAEYFQREFEQSIKIFGINFDYKYQADMYRSGKYVEYVLLALKKRKEIFDILDSHRTQEQQEGERDKYYPVNIYCPKCLKDSTTIVELSSDCVNAKYKCECGYSDNFNFKKDFNCKLAWKIDWPMRWVYEGVDFEPGGKDHSSPHGSYDTSKDIAKEIFNYKPPYFQGYEFIGIKGLAGKMSGSSGLNLTPDTLLKIYQPELLLWLYAKTDPIRAFDFCFDEGILNQYYEFDKMLDSVNNDKADSLAQDIIYLSTIKGRQIKTVPMSLIVQLGAIVDFNPQMMEVIFSKIGESYKIADFKDRIQLAKHWLKECSPDSLTTLRQFRNFDHYDTMSDIEKKEIKELFSFINNSNVNLDSLRDELYAIPKRVRNTQEVTQEVKIGQAKFFTNVYKLLINKEKGPRLYLFLYAIEKYKFIHLIDFSTPRRADEIEVIPPTQQVLTEKKPKVNDKPNIINPIKPQIVLDDFLKLDIRACTIVKCSEIRKSDKCYKIVVDDGINKDRVIVSSIKHDYSVEQLIGKKILVVANLKPTRIAGVESDGMLLACENNSCGTQVVFLDDIIPNGTNLK